MKTEYTLFKKYSNPKQANEVNELLIKNGIITRLGDDVSSIDSVIIGGNDMLNHIEISIKQSDFEKAHGIIKKYYQVNLDEVDKDYYLLKFSDEELFNVLLKPDEWGNIDQTLAKQILENRGNSIDDKLLTSLKKQRMTDLAKPDENQKIWIILGYVLAFLGGVLGIIIGYSLMSSKKTVPNGKRVYSYNENDRKHGKIIFIIGIIMIVLTASVKLMELLN